MARKKVEKQKQAPFELLADFERSIKFNKKNFKFTPKQTRFLNLILNQDSKIIFVSGPAGSSKTYMSLYGMLKLMEDDFSKDILYVRSIVESADRGLGSLPGDIAEKFDPFLGPLYDKMEEIITPGDASYLKQQGKVSAVPINFLRGASWQNKLVFADEAQNFTLKELTTLITRIGEKSKIIIGGDFFQSDINGRSGFKPMFDKFDDDESKEMGVHTFAFNEEDIVRSEILKFIIRKLESGN
jgi:phosphate starvation-inducible protein PhoH and related proteins